MTEERITRTETLDGNTHTTTTIVRDNERSGGGGKGWVMLALLAVVAIAAVLIFSQMSGAEVAKDNAVADAAGEVGEAAGQVGDTAQDAAGELTGDE